MFHVKNKIILSLIILCLCAATLLTSCTENTTNNNSANNPGPGQSTILTEPEKAHYLIKDTPADSPAKTLSNDGEVFSSLVIEKLSITQHDRINKPAAAKMKEVLVAQGEKRINDIYYSNADVLLAQMKQEDFDKSTLPHKMTVDYTCVRNDGRAISILETIDSYSADKLQSSITTAYNFIPLTGERIGQPFYTVGNSDEFNAADNTMYEKLLSKYGEEVISYNNVSASFVDAAADCWYFTQDGKGIAVKFSAGRIAPVEAGDLEIEYSKEELPEFAQKFFN